MSDQVKVEDLEVFRLFRGALLKFAQAAEQALSGADGQVTRTASWLEGEQMTFWQGQLRTRTEAATKAREVVRQKKLFRDASGRTPDASQEEKILAKCLAALEQAQQKIEAVRKWRPRLEKEAGLYRGGVSRLGKTLMDDVPKAVALLDRLAVTLEQYMQIETPAGNMAESTAPSVLGELMSRGGDAAPEAPPGTNDTVPPTTAVDQTPTAPASPSPPAGKEN